MRAPVAAALIGTAAFVARPVLAQSEARRFNIPAQALSGALIEFSRQSDVLVLFSPEIARGKTSCPLRGDMPVKVAIATLLSGSDLRAVPNQSGGYRVERVAKSRVAAAEPRSRRGKAGRAGAAPPYNDWNRTSEIIVTAQKREERLQDTPVPVTALDPHLLAERNLTRLQDYLSDVPGLSLNVQGNGKMNIVIRGISTGVFSNPTVAVTIDDVPYGSSVALADGQLVQPDLDPGDLRRIEVLRGPQGTLYGASSLGGLVKYVTADPSMIAAYGRFQAHGSAARRGAVGFGMLGTVNMPLGNTVAVRVNAYSRRTPGSVDNVVIGQRDVNTVDVAGGRAGMLWRPSGDVTVRVGVLHQSSRSDGTARVTTDYRQHPLLLDLQQAVLPGSGRYRTSSALFTANVDVDLGSSDLRLVTGYGLNSNREAGGFAAFGPVAQLSNHMRTRKFTQEVRLSSSMARSLAWRFGMFYTKENSRSVQHIDNIAPVSGNIVSNLITADFPTTYEEIAAFGDVTYHVGPMFSVQGGLRYSRNWQTYHETDTGPLGEIQSGVPFRASTRSDDDAFTFLAVPQFKFGSQMMAYVRFASGYRPGGPNGSAILVHLPEAFDADTTLNYEVGIKGDAADGRLAFDVSAYHIDWRKVQVRILDAVTRFSYIVNSGQARSDGVEVTVQFKTEELRLSVNGSYNLARYSKDPPAGVEASRGDRLPFAPRFSGNVSVDRDFPLGASRTSSVGATLAYIGDRRGMFPQQPGDIRIGWPAFLRLDLRMGVRSADWSVGLFARNVTDERGVLSSTSDTPRASTSSIYGTNFIPPRTLGLYLGRTL